MSGCPADALPLVDTELHVDDRAHFNRGAADFPIALSEMDITDGEEGAFNPNGNEETRPRVSCLISTFPAFSRGGIVRSPSDAIGSLAGTAPFGSGGSAKPPRAASSASRRVASSRSSRDGATPIVPGCGQRGMRTPGS